MIVAIVLAIIVLSTPVGLAPLLNITLKVILIISVYLLIRSGFYYRDEDSKIYPVLDSRITGLKESLDRIEKKVDKIDGILEKVSE
jgi:hypothetical protein